MKEAFGWSLSVTRYLSILLIVTEKIINNNTAKLLDILYLCDITVSEMFQFHLFYQRVKLKYY